MPWALIDVPPLSLGILRTAAAKAMPDIDIDVVHANLDYADWLAEQRGTFTAKDYRFFSMTAFIDGVGEWVFTSALYDDPEWRVAELRDQVPMSSDEFQLCLELHRSAPRFVESLTNRLLAFEPDLVGFTSTFQQNVPALAVARAIKKAAPGVLTVMGGANCDGVQGEAIHRNFEFVDFVVRGEGEVAFPQLLTALRAGEPLDEILGLCWREPTGRSVSNPMNSRPLAARDIVAPNYHGYFERLDASTVRDLAEPKLVVEGARGCWWGEKHHCKFCGLNGTFMEFRSKSPGAFFAEIVELIRRHQVLDLVVVDNILDMGYVTSLLPMIIEAGYDVRLQYEIKSNMRRAQLETLSAAGVVTVQPGIESLNTRVLGLMDKGVTGCQNVRMLRDSSSAGLTVAWNYLYGFPGEQAADYLPVIEQFPALHHLQPMDSVSRIAVERFSPYFNRPELGFDDVSPASQYGRNFDLPEAELLDLAYMFQVPDRGIDDVTSDRLRAAGAKWQRAFAGSRLSYSDTGASLLLVSRREGFDWSVLCITDDWEIAVFRLLDQPHSVDALTRKLSDTHDVALSKLEDLLRRWVDLGVVFTESDHYVHVVPQSTNQDLMRIDAGDQMREIGEVLV